MVASAGSTSSPPYLTTRPALFEHAGAPFHFVTTQASLAYKHLWNTGTVRVVPARLSDYPGLFGAGGPLDPDVALIQVSSPGPNGRVSLGLSVGANVDAARSAKLVIAQVNPNMPFTYGAGELALDEIDLLVEHEEPVFEARPADTSTDPIVQTIARIAAEQVPDGATLQFGVGAMPDAILGALSGHSGLSVHSGMLSEKCVELLELGAVTMTGKGADDGVMIGSEALATTRMAEWLHLNPVVRMAPPRYTHGAGTLERIPCFVALNSAVEIALDGSANSETANGAILSGPGGAPDYAFGASVSSGGRFICALKSTASGGKVSRIVPTIGPPNRVTLPRLPRRSGGDRARSGVACAVSAWPSGPRPSSRWPHRTIAPAYEHRWKSSHEQSEWVAAQRDSATMHGEFVATVRGRLLVAWTKNVSGWHEIRADPLFWTPVGRL